LGVPQAAVPALPIFCLLRYITPSRNWGWAQQAKGYSLLALTQYKIQILYRDIKLFYNDDVYSIR